MRGRGCCDVEMRVQFWMVGGDQECVTHVSERLQMMSPVHVFAVFGECGGQHKRLLNGTIRRLTKPLALRSGRVATQWVAVGVRGAHEGFSC